jgi:phosphoglycerate dehydrogenase-like enzyme
MSRSTESTQPIRIAVLDDFQQVALKLGDWQSIPAAEVTAFADHVSDPAALARRLEGFDVVCLMRERTPMPAQVLRQLPRLRLIVTTGLWNASLDIEEAVRLGIAVSGCSSEQSGTPELTWMLILALARHLPREQASMAAGGWQTSVGIDLEGSTLGILGLGRIGRRVATIANAFGMRVLAWSRNLDAQSAAQAGATRVEKEELLRESDFVTLHMKLSERSRGLIGESELECMKPTAFLVNTSRGPLVSEAALVAALQAGRIAGAGLDTFDEEPLPASHALRRLPNVIATPHIGYVTERTYRGFYRQIVENIRAWQSGEVLRPLTSNRLPTPAKEIPA